VASRQQPGLAPALATTSPSLAGARVGRNTVVAANSVVRVVGLPGTTNSKRRCGCDDGFVENIADQEHGPGILDIAVDRAPHPWEQRFAEYATSRDGCIGGDSTRSVPLLTGQRLWLFSDTLLTDNQMIHNCIVISPDYDPLVRFSPMWPVVP
jgi:hypothetical protein